RWAMLFEEAGFSVLTPGWPDDPETVQEANANPEVFAGQDDRAGGRSLRSSDRRAECKAGRDRALARRARDRDPRWAWPRLSVGGDQPCAVPRRVAASNLGAEVLGARPPQPGEPQPRRAAHL